jgi:hypothetical protein
MQGSQIDKSRLSSIHKDLIAVSDTSNMFLTNIPKSNNVHVYTYEHLSLEIEMFSHHRFYCKVAISVHTITPLVKKGWFHKAGSLQTTKLKWEIWCDFPPRERALAKSGDSTRQVVLPTNTSLNQDTSNPDLTIIITGVKA